MSVYFDANVLVAAFVDDAFSDRVSAFLLSNRDDLLTSDFACAEFVSAVGRLVRTGFLSSRKAMSAFSEFDNWTAQLVRRVEIEAEDVRAADSMLRRLDLGLRAPDAINIAVVMRSGAELATFDRRMADAASTLGVSIVKI